MQRTGSQILASHVEFPKSVSTELHNLSLRHVSPLKCFHQTFLERDHVSRPVRQPREGRRKKGRELESLGGGVGLGREGPHLLNSYYVPGVGLLLTDIYLDPCYKSKKSGPATSTFQEKKNNNN